MFLKVFHFFFSFCSVCFLLLFFFVCLKNSRKRLADSRWQCFVLRKWKKENREVHTSEDSRQEKSERASVRHLTLSITQVTG